ncbi:hypothetical protein QCA50_012451 [Cerrena zonata]|uniref:Protein kinase domain-containing protein n=1 Tax=Cerrena zonata TaxID=2478898 RepID=A0AAW0G294_9APHY
MPSAIPTDTSAVSTAIGDNLLASDDLALRLKLWYILGPWLESHGYYLYSSKHDLSNLTVQEKRRMALSKKPVEYPIAHVGDKSFEARRFSHMFNIHPAVTKDHQDVLIKPIFTEEDDSEVVILRYLMSERCRSDPLNMTMVTFDVLTIDRRLSLAVMPRWGSHFIMLDGFGTLGTALEFVHCMLKGLTFLHNNLIAHRDIHPGNVLVNFYDSRANFRKSCQSFFATGQAKFVIIDFGLSVIFPPDSDPLSRVCPAWESDCGSPEYHPPDVIDRQSETMYDPFAFDVACMGGMLCDAVGYLTPFFPSFAPLFDRMVTPDIPSRLTASQALDEFSRILANIDPKLLATEAPLPPPATCTWHSRDRWANLPAEFVEAHTKEYPPVRPKAKIYQPDGLFIFQDMYPPPVL